MWCSPTACIGEFDSLEGPRLKYAYEYFDYRHDGDCHDITQMVAFVGGDMLVGKVIASGKIHANYELYMRTIASRALVSNDSREESVVFQEPGGPVVGSICFSISDILARGEKRRFCLVFLHPSLSQLVARWPLISAFARMFIDDVTAQASARQDREYEMFADLERRREDARRNPLRSLLELAASEGEGEADVALRLHCYFEVCLPAIFASPISCALPMGGLDDAAALTYAFRCSVAEQLPFAELFVESIDVDEDVPVGAALVPQYAKNVLFPEEEIIVRPLTLWLTDFFRTDTAEPMHRLVNALFSGNQILISSMEPMEGVNLALSLTHMLPPSLVRWSVLAEAYVMPYTAQVVSFGARFLSTHTIVSRDGGAHAAVGATARLAALSSPDKTQLILEDLGDDNIVHVTVQGGRIHDVSWCASSSLANCSTIATRLVALVERACATAQPRAISTAALKLLTTQAEQLVSEYVVRGGVYTKLFREQEVEANRDALGMRTAGRPGSSATDRAFIQRFLSVFRASATSQQHASPSATAPQNLEKHSGLRKQSGAPFAKERFIFSSFSETDHDTLIFLGQASTIAAAAS